MAEARGFFAQGDNPQAADRLEEIRIIRELQAHIRKLAGKEAERKKFLESLQALINRKPSEEKEVQAAEVQGVTPAASPSPSPASTPKNGTPPNSLASSQELSPQAAAAAASAQAQAFAPAPGMGSGPR